MLRLCTFIVILLFAASAGLGATFVVSKTADTNDGVCDADCSLREAVAAANAAPTDDVVAFDPAFFGVRRTITLTLGEIVIANAGTFAMNGPGSEKLTIDGNLTGRILSTSTGVVAVINDARFTRGNGVGAANTGRAGAIYNNGGNLTVNNVVIVGNTANTGGAMNTAGNGTTNINRSVLANNTTVSSGGALQNFAGSTTNVNHSSIYGNTSGGSTGGGAFQANGTVRITNSTFANNSAPGGSGGGIAFNGTLLVVTNSTFVGNTSTNNGGGLHKSTANPGAVRNTILAGNTGGSGTPDVTGAMTSEGNNIIGNIGTSTGWVASDLQNTNPVLSPVGFYGGPGISSIPLSGSPALDAGQSCVLDATCTTNNAPVNVASDQRGAARPSNAAVDIGAVETNPAYTAVLPAGTVGEVYAFSIASNFSGFDFTVIQGGFGGVPFTATATTAGLDGTPSRGGLFNATVQVSNGSNASSIRYAFPVFGIGGSTIVHGRVLDGSGNPVRNASVTLTGAGGFVLPSVTTQFGWFYFDGVPPGDYVLDTTAKGIAYGLANVTAVNAVNEITISPLSVAKRSAKPTDAER
jgi:CSLREA domain-containing protein